ncbi:MAG TPA: TonB-dependent receptor [Porphyromonadaceae bacterium]|nr:TonB-dependent receptor [Porphyromonadaceae bacterium]
MKEVILNLAKGMMFLLLWAFSVCLLAQTVTVKGTVTDVKREPLIGVSVKIQGTAAGTVTDSEGNFTLSSVSSDAVLEISYIGMKTQIIRINGQANIEIVLEEDIETLAEVIAVGYGTQRKENLVGAVSAISGEEIQAVHSGDVTNAISGRLPGAIVMQPSGEPGRNEAKIMVRGRTTLGDNTGPLIVIDGIPDRSLYEIDPNDIESISLLKDASAAIYGSQAANGVVLVTTKSGSEGNWMSYTFYQGFKTPTILPKAANSAEYSQYISDYQDYEGLARLYSDKDIELYKSGIDPWEHPQTDWMSDLVRKWTNESNHHLSLSGSHNKMRYYASLGYRNDQAMYAQESTHYKQYNLRLKLDIPITDWLETSVSYGGFMTNRKYPTTPTYQLVGWASMVIPTQPSFWPTGEPGPDFEGGVNPVVNTSFEAGYDQQDNYKNEVTFRGTVKPEQIKGFSLNAFYTLDINNQNRKLFKKPWTLYYADWDNAERNSEGYVTKMELIPRKRGLDNPELTEANFRHIKKMYNISASYEKDFGDHAFSVFGAFEEIKTETHNFDAYRKYFISDLVQTLDAGGEKDKSNSGWMGIYARQSWIGRLNYNFREKYLFEFIFRRDGSLKFPPNSRWGNFPALLFAWRASEENFWKDHLSVIDYFKFRTSYGQMGMDPGDPFQYINKYSLGTGMTFGENKDVVTKIYQSVIANPNITWEKQTTFNVGFDSQILNQMFHLNTEFFYNKRSDILAARNASIPSYTGLALPLENIAIVDNRGFEIDAGFHKKITPVLGLDITGNFSWNKNTVVFMDEPEVAVPWQRATGLPYGSHLVYKAIGIFKDQAHVDSYPHWSGAKPGDVIFEDVSGDKVINADDRILLDKTDAPRIFYGLMIDLTYKNWSLSLQGQGQGSYYKSPIEGNRGIGMNV